MTGPGRPVTGVRPDEPGVPREQGIVPRPGRIDDT